MFYIGNVKIANQVVLAPMAGITDRACRVIAKSFGCGLVFTEMISDMGLVYKQSRTHRIADTSGEQRPVAIQLFGSNPASMAEAARIVQDRGADIIDINMGCPTPKIVKNGEGAALMLDIPRARAIIRAVVDTARVPVTVKMRKGWDGTDPVCLELAQVAEEEGVAALTLHPRTRMQFFSGHSDWSMIKAVKELVRIPVIGNGDIHNADDALRMLQETGCDAVMIGRAALGNPFILRETVEFLNTGRRLAPPTYEERVEVAERHLELTIQLKGEWVGVREMRKQLAWYFKGRPGAAQIRTRINQATSKEEILGIMHSSL
ncbi:MAG: tRNA dihydrouridine synthase DusB [Syntrophomonadaceae bacterium]|nr:tRNA dihydrouridine synthase DusB [Syntrophomonadaceae bacterium]